MRWLSRTLFPAIDQGIVWKRIRGRIRYAQKNNRLPKTDLLVKSVFLLWAAATWPELRRQLRTPVLAEGKASLPLLTSTGLVVVGPADKDDLPSAYVESESARHALDAQNQLLRAKLEVLEAKAKSRAERDEELSKKRRDAGKKGGRGKSR